MQPWLTPLNQAFAAKMGGCAGVDPKPFLHAVEKADVIKAQIPATDQQTAVGWIDYMAVDCRLHVITPRLVVRNGEVTFSLRLLEVANA